MRENHTDNLDVFDVEAALDRVDRDEPFLCELATLFLQECPNWLNEIETGLVQQESLAVSQAAHSLKGAASNFAADTTVAAAQHLESTARAGNLAEASLTFRVLRSEVERLRQGLIRLVTPTAEHLVG